MAKAKVTVGVSRLNSAQLIAKGNFVLERMTANPRFPDPTPPLSELSAAIDALIVAQVAAYDGGITVTATRRSCEGDVRLILNQMGGHVSSVAEGDELAIRSSGLGVRRIGEPASEPGSPVDLRARISDHSGRVDLSWKPTPQAVTYHIMYSSTDPEVEANWKLVHVSTRSRRAVKDLPSARIAYFRVAAIGSAGMGPWSQVASTLVR